MSSDNEARQARRRVLLLFAVSILPPLILLTVLAVVAARNDQAALRHVQEERTHQTATRTSAKLRGSIRAAEEELIGALDLSLLRDPEAKKRLKEMFRKAARERPLAQRFLAVELESGALLWPDPQAPFRLPEERAPLPREGSRVQDYRRLAELRATYDRSTRQAAEGRFDEAIAGLQVVVASPASTSTLNARAASRLGRCLEEIDQPVAARQAYLRAAQAPIPVRDEEGRPIRVKAALRRCELLLREGDPEEAGDEALGLARALVLGRRRDDVGREEWQDALERTRNVLSQAGLADRDSEFADLQAEILDHVQWRMTLDKLLPPLLDAARRTQTGEIRHHFRLGSPPQLLAYRVLPAIPPGEAKGRRSGPILLAIQIDLALLSKDVIRPACGAVSLQEEAAIAVTDAHGIVQAYAGAAAKPNAEGRLADDTQTVSAPLQSVPLWQVQVTRSTKTMEQARRNRLVLYGALITLTLLTAVAGAIATIRYVERSLELAKMKSDFVSNITHELKTPLTSIKMYGEMLMMGVKNEEKRAEYAEHIVREGNRLQKLIEDVLDFARQDTGKHEYVLAEEDVADTVTEALDLFRHSAKVRGFDLFVDLPPIGKLPPVDLDRDAIVRSVLNLLSNAVKYSTDERYVKVVVAREEDAIAITVEDKGIGIDGEDLEKIFDRFYRAGDELTRGVSGAGLGLSLIDQIVQAHSGHIRVASEKGSGSAFTILLPIVEDFRTHWPPGSADSTPPDPDSELLATTEELEDEPDDAEPPLPEAEEEDAPASTTVADSAEERS